MSGLSFLSKKSWHTSNLKNQERVWVEEQRKEAEDAKLEEFKAQLEEERELDRLRELQENSGLIKRDAHAKGKLAWMYRGTEDEKQEKELTAEELLMQSARGNVPLPQEARKQEEQGAVEEGQDKAASRGPGALWDHKPSSNPNEAFRKLHQDPLFALKRREQELREEAMRRHSLAAKAPQSYDRELSKKHKREKSSKRSSKRHKHDKAEKSSKRKKHSSRKEERSRKHPSRKEERLRKPSSRKHSGRKRARSNSWSSSASSSTNTSASDSDRNRDSRRIDRHSRRRESPSDRNKHDVSRGRYTSKASDEDRRRRSSSRDRRDNSPSRHDYRRYDHLRERGSEQVGRKQRRGDQEEDHYRKFDRETTSNRKYSPTRHRNDREDRRETHRDSYSRDRRSDQTRERHSRDRDDSRDRRVARNSRHGSPEQRSDQSASKVSSMPPPLPKFERGSAETSTLYSHTSAAAAIEAGKTTGKKYGLQMGKGKETPAAATSSSSQSLGPTDEMRAKRRAYLESKEAKSESSALVLTANNHRQGNAGGTKQLSQAELDAKRSEMSMLGQQNERQRKELSEKDRLQRSQEDLGSSKHDGELPEFLRTQDLSQGRSLEQRLRSQQHTRQRLDSD
mmetsp:Transcript_13183/g.24443  ORF Transcript_13183/g.24443 Transcript_13183/m.24443 type:complete len:623 (+) Transcript_13183:45-1913(+)